MELLRCRARAVRAVQGLNIMSHLRKLSVGASRILNVKIVRSCAILQINNGENRFNPETISCMHEALDYVEESDAKALIITGTGKFFSNGLDLDWVMKQDETNLFRLKKEFSKLNGRMLYFPALTVAAINGHAYAGGGIFAFAHDYRIMREDRGWTRLTEIRLKLRPSPGLLRMIRAKIPSQKTAFDYIIGAKRFTGPEAFVGGIVHRLAKKENVINDSIDMVQEIVDGKVFDKATVRKLKIDLYGELYKEIMREFMKDDVQLLFTPK